MSLFTSTQVINDGSTDHTFVFRGQIPNAKSLVSEYFEPANMAGESKIQAKYENSNSPAQRSVLSSTVLLPDADGNMCKCTINTSVAFDKKCDIASVEDRLDLHIASLSLSGVRTRFLQRMP